MRLAGYGGLFAVLRRAKICLSACAAAELIGLLLVLVFDFVSQVTIFLEVSTFLRESAGGVGYAVAAALALGIAAVPLDTYFLVWGTERVIEAPLVVPLQLVLYFGVVGAVIGYRSRGLADALVNSFLLLSLLSIALGALVFLLGELLLGSLLVALIEGITGRSLVITAVCAILENGAVTAVFAAFVASLVSPSGGERASCDPGEVCEI
jgi:hypothetical protein